MKKIQLLVFSLAIFFLSSCQAIGEIFKAGVWVGVLVVIGVIALIMYLISRGKRN